MEHSLNNVEDWVNEFRSLNPAGEKETGNAKEYKLDLFSQVLPAIDRNDRFFYSKLTTEEQNSIEPWLLMRWLTSCDDKDQVHFMLSVNDLVNNNFSAMSPRKTQGIAGHKELQWMLLTLCGTGKSVRRKFLKPAKGAVKNKLEEALLVYFPLLRDDELELLMKINSTEDFETFFKDNGLDDKTINELLKNAKGK